MIPPLLLFWSLVHIRAPHTPTTTTMALGCLPSWPADCSTGLFSSVGALPPSKEESPGVGTCSHQRLPPYGTFELACSLVSRHHLRPRVYPALTEILGQVQSQFAEVQGDGKLELRSQLVGVTYFSPSFLICESHRDSHPTELTRERSGV